MLFLIGGGVWLGVVLTKANNQAVSAISFEICDANQKKYDVILLVNGKNKIISNSIFENDFDEKLSNKKEINGKSVKDFSKSTAEYFSKIDNDKYQIIVEIYGVEHSKVLQIKNLLKQSFEKNLQKNSKKYQILCKNYTKTSNMEQKYQKLNEKYVIENYDFEEKNESDILNNYKNFKKKDIVG